MIKQIKNGEIQKELPSKIPEQMALLEFFSSDDCLLFQTWWNNEGSKIFREVLKEDNR